MRPTSTPFRRISRILLACVLLVGAAVRVDAQLLDVPAFVALDRTNDVKFGSYSFATGSDSSILVLASTWTRDINDDAQVVQRYSPSGTPIGGLVRVDEADHTPFVPQLIADSRGGFYATWQVRASNGFPFAARPLGATGIPTGPDFVVGDSFGYFGAASALPSGAVLVWNDQTALRGIVVDPTLHPLGPIFTVTTFPSFAVVAPRVAAKADGGFVVAWEEQDRVRGRVYDAAGVPVGPALELLSETMLGNVAAGPFGGFVVLGYRAASSHRLAPGVWARRFDDAGAPSSPSFLIERGLELSLLFPVGDFDAMGRLYVAWEDRSSRGIKSRGRVYDAAGRALQDSFVIADEPMSFLQLAARPDGRFVEGWARTGGDLVMQVRALCVPPDHTGCGNGVIETPCERCDDGPANDDATPDACRTTCMPAACGDGTVDGEEQCDDGNLVGCDGCDNKCRLEVGYVCGDGILSADCEEECDDGASNADALPNACRANCRSAHCSDGVVDDGEECDDGNLTSCDGCSDRCVAEPGLVCGDGIPEVLCGEECDDGNAVVGDGCSAPCHLERIFGGGSPATDCIAEWVVDNPANVPLLDAKHGGFSASQVCQDGDPRCDFGGVAGSCTFHVRVCGNNTDAPSCTPDPQQRLRSWELRAPSAAKAAKHPELVIVRAAFAAVPGAIIGPNYANVCSNTLDVVVPLKTSAAGAKANTLVLKSYTTLYTGTKDSDKLKLVCRP